MTLRLCLWQALNPLEFAKTCVLAGEAAITDESILSAKANKVAADEVVLSLAGFTRLWSEFDLSEHYSTIMQRDHFRAPPTSREDLEHALKIAMAEWKSSYDEESAVKARERVVAARAALGALIAPIVPVSGGN